MTKIHPHCENIATQVNQIIELLQKHPDLRVHQPTTQLETSLQKVISPKFEIVFAGAFSAGKSMLINALLECELLYSAEGHATGTECYIEYAPLDKERVELTFLSEIEIREQINTLGSLLHLNLAEVNINQPTMAEQIKEKCQEIITQEGGENKSERGKQAKALFLLLEGFESNRQRIQTTTNATYSMEQLNLNNLTEGANYARRGKNSAVLKKIKYFCCHPLLEDGNVLVDLPGIDAPIKKDAELTYRKIEDSNTSAVICVLKAASAGEMSQAETDLLDKIKSNPAIRDRVFYVFNRIDSTWYNAQLKQRLDNLIKTDFQHTNRIYKTSGLLGFYGSQIKQTSFSDRFGLDSIFADSIKAVGGEEETPQFVSEFNNYCGNSRKLNNTNFMVSVNGFDTPNQNYFRILSEWGMPLIEKLINDSGINSFKAEITRYLTEEKRPELYKSLAEDLSKICMNLSKHYQNSWRDLESQPQEIEAMKQQKLSQINNQLKEIGNQYYHYIEEHVNLIINNENKLFNQDFQYLQSRFINRLDELLHTFSVANTYSLAVKAHPRNQTAPLLAVLVEALYAFSNALEDSLIAELEGLVANLIKNLVLEVQQQDFYGDLYNLLGNDGDIEIELKELEEKIYYALKNEATTECDRYVRESPQFYNEGTFSIYQFRETLKQTSQAYDASAMIEGEPAIRQLLKLDFEQKVSKTIRHVFRQTINQTIKTNLLPMAKKKADDILQKYDLARENSEATLEKDAQEKIAENQQKVKEINHDCFLYNEAISGINSCLEAMKLSQNQLPLVSIPEN